MVKRLLKDLRDFRVAFCLTLVGCGGIGVASATAAISNVDCSAGGGGLQSAINAASSGDTVRVRGACTGNFDVPGAGSATSLTLQGINGASLDGAAHGTTLLIHRGAGVSVEGLQIRGGGNVFEGGGIGVFFATLHLSDSSVSGNGACTGGGIAILHSTATITNSVVRDNSAGNNSVMCNYVSGAGLEIDQGSTLTMRASTVNGNAAADGGVGGGIDIFGASVALVDSTLRGNKADWNGGGISNQYGSTLSLRGSSVTDNAALHNGGGGLVNDGASASVTESAISRNTVAHAGGGILQFSDVPDPANNVTGNAALTLKDSMITDNTASGGGGGGIANFAFNSNNAPFGADGTVTTIDATGVRLSGNQAPTSSGGGIWNAGGAGGQATVSFKDTRITANSANFGGGIANEVFDDPNHLGGLGTVSLAADTFVTANTASTDGGGIHNGTGASMLIAPGATVARNRPNDCTGC